MVMTVFEYSTLAKDYLALLIMLVIAVLLTMVILTFSYLLAKQNPDSEKLTAYECGLNLMKIVAIFMMCGFV